MRAWIGSVVVAVLAAIASTSPAFASSSSGPVTAKWYAQAVVKFTLTPNFASNCGMVKAVFGVQPTPMAPPQGCMTGGAVDFGGVTAGTNYLYRNATQLDIQTNDSNGVNIYGEGAADFVNNTGAGSVPLNQAVYYLTSNAGNTGFTPGFPFYATAGSVSGNTFGTAPSITYTTYPSPVAFTSAGGTTDFFYDYELKIPPTTTQGQYYVWIVYTVVPK